MKLRPTTPAAPKRGVFSFKPPAGDEVVGTIELPPSVVSGRRLSRRGTAIMVFPAPFSQIEIADGERVSVAKMATIRAAVASLWAVYEAEQQKESRNV